MTKTEMLLYQLKRKTRRRKITQAAVAGEIGISPKTLNRHLMSGDITLNELVTACDMLGLESRLDKKGEQT